MQENLENKYYLCLLVGGGDCSTADECRPHGNCNLGTHVCDCDDGYTVDSKCTGMFLCHSRFFATPNRVEKGSHIDLDGPKVSKKSRLRQNGL